MGLAITKRLTKLLGGTLSLTSEPKKGSVFTLTIPADVNTEQQSLDKYESIEQLNRETEPQLPQKASGRVLIAEDNPSNQMLMKLLVKRAGYHPVVVSDGLEAVEKAKSQNFDLILMDMQMPNLNGYQATCALRKEGFTMPIIATTAYAMTGDAEKCIEAGCNDYLEKPISTKKLRQVLKKYIKTNIVQP